MYVEDQAQQLLTGLHSFLSCILTLVQADETEAITQELRALASEGEIQLVGPDLFQAVPDSAKYLSADNRRFRAAIQRMWNVEGRSAEEISTTLVIATPSRIRSEILSMRRQGWVLLRHNRGGGLAETVVLK